MTAEFIKTIHTIADKHFYPDETFEKWLNLLVKREIIQTYELAIDMFEVLDDFSLSAHIGNVTLFSTGAILHIKSFNDIFHQYKAIDDEYRRL